MRGTRDPTRGGRRTGGATRGAARIRPAGTRRGLGAWAALRSRGAGAALAGAWAGIAAALAPVAVGLGLALGASPLGAEGLRPLATLDTTPGLVVYEASCAACHGFAGEGLRAAFPPLAGNVPRLLAVEGGRQYLVDVLLQGLSGAIEVAGERYEGLMPSWAHLSDQQLADVLNHVATAWGNAAQLPPGAVEFTALEVALERAFPVDQATLIATRQALTRLSEQ